MAQVRAHLLGYSLEYQYYPHVSKERGPYILITIPMLRISIRGKLHKEGKLYVCKETKLGDIEIPREVVKYCISQVNENQANHILLPKRILDKLEKTWAKKKLHRNQSERSKRKRRK